MEIISLTSKNFQNIVEYTARVIKKGGVVAVPTDTVYGIIADATNECAVKKIFSLKKRPPDKALPIFVKNIAMAKKIAAISAEQQKKIEELWPGKITSVFKSANGIKIFGIEKETIALRIPFYPFINSLLETLNIPLAETSANISGLPASTRIDDILAQFKGQNYQPDLVINAGDLSESKPSTIINMVHPEIKTIRL
jgi:L-threonylcarbamoyladenylate synthase